MAGCFGFCSGKRADTREPNRNPDPTHHHTTPPLNFSDVGSTLPEPNPPELRKYEYEDLSEATENFRNKKMLGSGGFGDVFEGFLDGEAVAIKKFKYASDEKPPDKIEEMDYLIRVSHPNVVKLIGYCDDGLDKLLVLELVPNKTLRHHLNNGKENVLNWPRRRNIAIKAARGLQYLHEWNIIHRDIKTNNILLDNDFEPKVTDFSISKFLPNIDGISHITSKLKGTNVYVDPEFGEIQKVSKKSDVYSFGVVLLELISGKKPLFDESDNIVSWAESRIKEALNNKNYTDFVDSELKEDYNERQMRAMIFCARACIYEPSHSRPNMEEIIKILEEIDYEKRTPFPVGAPIDLQSTLDIESIHITPRTHITPPIMFEFRQLAEATESFDHKNLIGMGKFYKGSLINDERIYAIKKLEYLGESSRDDDEFMEKIRAISGICHRHIVKLIGCCIEETNRLLVYEYLAKNSLSPFHGNYIATSEWSTRMKVAEGLAKGLAYLHEWCQPKIIHGNVKMSSILLDDSLEPKISDFGFAKENLHFSKSKSSTVDHQNGGYLAPEYKKSRQLTDKGDIFSFGIILLELITGKRAVEENEDGVGTTLSVWVAPRLRKALQENNYNDIIDTGLKSYDEGQMKKMIYCAASCVYRLAHYRPRMSQIVKVLQGDQNFPEQSIWLNNDRDYLCEGAPYIRPYIK
ncbi:receptor like protein kinase S.2 isoform X2 [Hevea brasiliensis]|uniref:receptor like protein kinase S.2 isoform X2 n=1 Tax=Hevea brasiliensis TaxID=3981 RepID=UPI0025E35090|nr:receptor like protein kinase S.2 isoform X2 [Hevea brasiliensis]